MSCTSTTTKVAQAISLMSDVLSAEVAVAQHILDVEENDRIECADDHEELKNLANDFATENQEGLEEVQSDLQTEVENDDDDNPYFSFDDDDGEDDENDEEDNDSDSSDSADNDDADKAEPTDEEKIEALEDKIAEHEQTIKDLKNTMETALDNINTLVTAAETFRDQVEEY